MRVTCGFREAVILEGKQVGKEKKSNASLSPINGSRSLVRQFRCGTPPNLNFDLESTPEKKPRTGPRLKVQNDC